MSSRWTPDDLVPGPSIWCRAYCGIRVDDYIGGGGEDAPVLVVLRDEPYWFCGVACAVGCLEELYRAVYETGETPLFLLTNAYSDN